MEHLRITKVRHDKENLFSLSTNILLDNIAQFPTLNENQIKKLKHLSIATLSETSQV